MVSALALTASSLAFPWTITHDYTGCAQCHVDPLGAGALTEYGRAQGEVLLRTRWSGSAEDPGRIAGFLFGAVDLPEPLVLQGELRGLLVPEPGDVRALLMQADLRAALSTGPFVASASAGVVSGGAEGARLLRGDLPLDPVVRDAWAAIRPTEATLIRAGRAPLPFGLRTDEHLRYTRAVTRTTTNDDQQLGVGFGGTARRWRGEATAVAGNPAVSPDPFRERGGVGTLSWLPGRRLDLGLSGLVLATGADVETLAPRIRQAWGAHARGSPIGRLALEAEADLLVDGPGAPVLGFATEVSADLEPVQGLHLEATGEACGQDPRAGVVARAGVTAQWFFAPHTNLRVDALHGPLLCDPEAAAFPMVAAQLHLYL